LSQFGLPGEAGFGLSASAGALLPVTGVGPSFGFEGSFSAMVTTECRYCISAQGTLLAGVGVMGSIGAGGAASYAAGSLSGPGAGFGFGAAGGGVEGAPLGGTVSYDVDLLNQGLGAAEAHVGPTIALAGYGRAFVSCTGCADPLNGGWLDRLFPQVVAQQRLAQCILSNVAKLAGQAFR
jgi:hypothetical protein